MSSMEFLLTVKCNLMESQGSCGKYTGLLSVKPLEAPVVSQSPGGFGPVREVDTNQLSAMRVVGGGVEVGPSRTDGMSVSAVAHHDESISVPGASDVSWPNVESQMVPQEVRHFPWVSTMWEAADVDTVQEPGVSCDDFHTIRIRGCLTLCVVPVKIYKKNLFILYFIPSPIWL